MTTAATPWGSSPDEVQGLQEMDLLGEVLAAVNGAEGPLPSEQVDRALGLPSAAA